MSIKSLKFKQSKIPAKTKTTQRSFLLLKKKIKVKIEDKEKNKRKSAFGSVSYPWDRVYTSLPAYRRRLSSPLRGILPRPPQNHTRCNNNT
jgi:hypothetical protein